MGNWDQRENVENGEDNRMRKRSCTRVYVITHFNVIVPKLEYVDVWEGNTKLVKKLETVPMTAAKKILGCSKTASNTALRAELGMYSLKTET